MATFDELNNIQRSEPYDLYFSSMDITDEQEQERISFAERFEEIMLFMFALVRQMRTFGSVNSDFISQQVGNKYKELAREFNVDTNFDGYISNFAILIVANTLLHIDDDYYLSNDRAMLVAENESNTTLNYKDYMDAILVGKTQKKWLGVLDNRIREHHREISGKVIPIDDLFLVGDSYMLYPKDESYGANASEIVNCRCSIKYF